MKKKPMIKRTPSGKEVRMYNAIEFEFILALSNKDLQTMKMLFSDTGTFFGKLGKWQALKFFKDQFASLTKNDEEIRGVKTKIALGVHAGRRALLFNDGEFPRFDKIKTKPLAFVLEVEGDLLKALYLTCNCADLEDFEEIGKYN